MSPNARLLVARWLVVACCLGLSALTGCGQPQTSQTRWQEALSDSSLTSQQKLGKVAGLMFDLESYRQQKEAGKFSVTLMINTPNPSGIVRTLAGKDGEVRNQALKQFHLRPLISQLGNFIHYARVHHLGDITVEVNAMDVSGDQVLETRSVQYAFHLPEKKFDDFLEASKLGAKQAMTQCEQVWTVQKDAWK